MSTLSFDEYSRKKGTIETVTSSNAKLPRARVEVVHPYLALMGLYCGGFAGMYSETALNIALPQLSLAFGVDVSVTQWLVVGYMLVIGVVLPFASLLMKWFSARKLTLFALGAFFVGAVASAVAPSFPVALAGRAVQGIGTGLVLPIMFAMVLEVIPPHKIGAAMGTNALVIMFAPAIGPTLAGALIGAGSWRLVFASFAVIALVGIVFAWKFEVNPYKLTRPSIDAPSVVLSVVGFGGIVLGAGMASSCGWASPIVLGGLVAGLVCLALYVRRQLSMEVPVIDMRIFSHQGFRVGAVCMVVNFGITLSAMYILPQFYQNGMLLAVAVTGVVMLPGGIVNAVCTLMAGRLFDRHGARVLVWIGVVMVAIGGALFFAIGVDSGVVLFLAAHIIVMVGIPFIQQSAQSAALKSLPGRMAADGSTILNTMQQVCGAIATAVATCLLGLGQTGYAAGGGANAAQGFVDGSRYGYMFGLVLVAIVLVFSFMLKGGKEEPKLVPVQVDDGAVESLAV